LEVLGLTRSITFAQALLEAIDEEMSRSDRVFLIGNGAPSALEIDQSILAKNHPDRLVNAPISEEAIMGCALGASIAGMRPIAYMGLDDWLFRAADQIFNEVAKTRYTSGGQIKLPLVIRAVVNTGFISGQGATHAQSLISLFTHVPGLQIAIPANPADAKGLFLTAIRGENPVIFFEHTGLYNMQGPISEESVAVPFGTAEVLREGSDVTFVGDMFMVNAAMRIAPKLESEGVMVEIINLRTLVPLDLETILKSVRKTKNLVIGEQGPKTGGIGAEISALVCESNQLSGISIRRVAARDSPIPASRVLERKVLPSEQQLMESLVDICKKS
jgi:pyruvate/2-oxoglutarate/acetoin dehydrogenase E1 component